VASHCPLCIPPPPPGNNLPTFPSDLLILNISCKVTQKYVTFYDFFFTYHIFKVYPCSMCEPFILFYGWRNTPSYEYVTFCLSIHQWQTPGCS
jgi:hypothetical protein